MCQIFAIWLDLSGHFLLIFHRAYHMDKENQYYVSYVIMKVWKLLILKPNQAEAKPRKPKTIL